MHPSSLSLAPFPSMLDPDVAVPACAGPERFRFRGTGSEYFRIWIVNLLLTVATLGIYSVWAKVRKTRYFYGNATVAGSSFEDRGNTRWRS